MMMKMIDDVSVLLLSDAGSSSATAKTQINWSDFRPFGTLQIGLLLLLL